MSPTAGRLGGIAAALVVAALAIAYRYEPVASWDEEVAAWVAATMPGWGEWAGRPFSWLGNWAVMTVFAVGATVAFLRASRRADALAVAVAGISSLVVTQVLKAVFDRPRPDLDPAVGLPPTAAFPSGHASSAAALFVIVAALAGGRRAVAAAALLALAVGGSRIVLGVHWASDVLAGWALGAVCVWLGYEAARARSRRARPPAPGGRATARAG